MRVSFLCDNTAALPGVRAEYGLCIMIETETRNMLLDTGASALFSKNADRLNLEMAGIDDIILSHGHFDHGGGLAAALQTCRNARLWIHPEAVAGKYSNAFGALHYVGLPPGALDAVRDADESGRVGWVSATAPIDENNWLILPGGKRNPAAGWPFSKDVAAVDKMLPDLLEDEIALLITGNLYSVVFVGSAYSGIISIVEAAEAIAARPIKALIGNILPDKLLSETELQTAADYLLNRKIALYCAHNIWTPAARHFAALCEHIMRPVYAGYRLQVSLDFPDKF